MLGQGEFRQRLDNGAYQIRAYGIDQLDPGAFAGQPGDRQFRGGVETKGQFAINDKWVWGWDGVVAVGLLLHVRLPAVAIQRPAELVPEPADRSDLAALSDRRRQSQLLRRCARSTISASRATSSQVPVVYPVIDYSNVFNYPIFGGEVSATRRNFVSLIAQYTPRSIRSRRWRIPTASALHDVRRPDWRGLQRNCLLRGMPGTYTRVHRRSAVAQIVHRFRSAKSGRRSSASRVDAINADVTQPAGRQQLPADRRHQRAAGDADGRPRIPLPLHQRAALGHHDHRADRAGHHPSERVLRRQVAERRRPEPGSSTPATSSASTNSPATTASKAADALMWACRRRRNSIAVVPSSSCSASPTICSA